MWIFFFRRKSCCRVSIIGKIGGYFALKCFLTEERRFPFASSSLSSLLSSSLALSFKKKIEKNSSLTVNLQFTSQREHNLIEIDVAQHV